MKSSTKRGWKASSELVAIQTELQQQIEILQEQRLSLLNEEPVMWDEVNAVERELKFLGAEVHDYLNNKPYAAEDAAVAMMESAARKNSR